MIPYATHSIVKLGTLYIPMSPLLNFIGGLTALYFMIKFRKSFNAKIKEIIIICFLVGLFGIGIGSRVFYYFGPWGMKYTIAERFLNLINFMKPGMMFYGGLVFSILTIYIYCKIRKLDYKNYLNLITPGLFLGQFFGRIGCFLHGCCIGKETAMFCALDNLKAGTQRFPTTLMLSINALILFIIIMNIKDRKLWFPVGLMLYSSTRFTIEFLRQYDWTFLGLGFSQLISIVLFFTGLYLYRNWKNDRIHKAHKSH